MKLCALMWMVIAAFCFTACGGGSKTTTTPPPTTYTIGGTASGLSGTGLVLQNNGGDNLSVSANGAFTFATRITSGGAYNVTVLTQPSAQICAVTSGTGTVSANVTTVQVACTATFSIGGVVSGLSGAGLVLQNNGGDNLSVGTNGGFTFATLIASGGTYKVTVLAQPSGPAQTCLVASGSGTASANVATVQVTCSTANAPAWVWVNGANVVNQQGTYGTEGTAAASNVPGARNVATSWTDATGNFWLFSGIALTGAAFNDLWKYSAGQWTWMSGSNTTGQVGVYGTLGTAASSNVPGARAGAVSWIDAAGNFWLFGGNDGTGNFFNDLWKYSAGEWTWMSGSNVCCQPGSYGTIGTAAPGNIPGARWEAVTWTDASGNLWLFGGNGLDSANAFGPLNDLWKYSAGQWTWMSGSNLTGQLGTYGTLGEAASTNIPGARNQANGWTDAAGDLWLFGGYGFDSAGTLARLNDLWKWKYSAGEWTWMSGSNVGGQAGSYGTLGTAAPGNVPGARWAPVGWTDAARNFWLFGGNGFDSAGSPGELNDLWEYSSGQWTWMGGANTRNQQGTYGTAGTAAPNNLPGGRDSAVGWFDGSGNLWLFGGNGYDSTGQGGELNDLWKFEP